MIVAGRLLKNVVYAGLSTPHVGLNVPGAWTPVVGSVSTGQDQEGVACWVMASGQSAGGFLDIKCLVNGESIHVGDPWRISCDVAMPQMVQVAGGNFPAIYLPKDSIMTFELYATAGAPVIVHFNAVFGCWYSKEWDEAIPRVCFPTENPMTDHV
jgi:hypothetical protein